MIQKDLPHVIIITEVLSKAPNISVSEASLTISGYNLFTNFDFLNLHGCRGVCMYVLSSINVEVFTLPVNISVEHLWIKLHLNSSDYLLVGGIYRSPSLDFKQSTLDICYLFQCIHNLNSSHLLIVGDFNYSNITWGCDFVTTSCHVLRDFINTIQDCYFFQHVFNATRYRSGQVPHILDLIFTNEENMVSNLEYLPSLGNSDHVCLKFTYNCYIENIITKETTWKFNCADYDQIRQDLEKVNWSQVMDGMSVHEAWDYFSRYLYSVMQECIPRCSSIRKNKNIYVNAKVFRLRKLKHHLWSQYLRSNSEVDYRRYANACNQLRALTRSLRTNFEQDIAARV